jgi:3-deoxy-manno-octulosonate cytidylyltransferase (CMP-KDO synthetase)
MKNKIIGIIPARWNSTRFPGKPLHAIAGKPLIQHVWERCMEAECFDRTIIATDDMRIAEAAFYFGAEVAMTSPDHLSGTDRIAEVALKLQKTSLIFNVQGDEPTIAPSLLSELVETFSSDRETGMITAAVRIDAEEAKSEHHVKVVLDARSNALYFSRSVIPFPRNPGTITFYKHLGIYGYRRDTLLDFVKTPPSELEQAEQLEQLRALQNGVKIRVVVSETAAIGVDTPEDARTVERLILSRNSG